MELETRKLHFIEEVLKINKQDVMDELEEVLRVHNTTPSQKHDFKKFTGVMNDDDATEMLQIIEDGCEKIDQDGWK